MISTQYSEKIFDDIDNLPSMKVGLVLGTAPRTYQGTINRYFQNRILAAVELYQAGKIQYILASGDNGELSYNEPIYMQRDLMRYGIPEDRIILDYAGFSTLDSVLRAQLVFGQSEAIIISQEFHNQRAVYIANENNINAVAYNAEDVQGYASVQVQFREYFARLKAILDVHILRRSPRFTGPPEFIPD